jgi:hypothetical protein
MHMVRKQRGMTTIGMILAAAVMGLIVFAGLRLIPVYLDYMKVGGVLDSVQSELGGTNPSVGDLRRAIQNRIDIERVESVKADDYKISKAGKGYTVRVTYTQEAPYVANVYFLVKFDKSVEIAR